MFGIGTPELLLILAVALIVIGPKKLPDLAKSLGRAMGEFKRATSDLKQSIEQESGLSEVRNHLQDVKQDLLKPQADAEAHVEKIPPVAGESITTPRADDETGKPDRAKDQETPLV